MALVAGAHSRVPLEPMSKVTVNRTINGAGLGDLRKRPVEKGGEP